MVSYRKSHIKSRIHKIKPKKSILRRLSFWITILLLILILSVCYFTLFYPGFKVKNVVIYGNEKVKNQELLDLVYKNASKSIFLVNSGKISESILEKFPVIEKISVDKKFPQTLILGIVERKPLGVFCAKNNECFLIDNNGIVFEKLSVSPSDITIVRQTIEDRQVFTGEEVVNHNVIEAIYDIQKYLQDNFKINVKEALVTSPLRLNISTSEKWKIYFDLDLNSNINSQLIKLGLLLDKENSRENLRYIDLRPKDRAIVCDNAVCEK